MDTSSQQFDLSILLLSATNLPNADFLSKSDPYLVIAFDGKATYQTKVVSNDLNPVWSEQLWVANVPDGAQITIQVYDKDVIMSDDLIGCCCYTLQPLAKINGNVESDGSWGWHEDLSLSVGKKSKGSVQIRFACSRSKSNGKLRLSGPVRWRRHTCYVTGLLTHVTADSYTYKLFLHNIKETFDGKQQPWNKDYPAAQKIFQTKIIGLPLARSSVTAQHQAMYASDPNTVHGVSESASSFFAMLNFGRRNGEQRYYTYVIMEDAMRFSETGAAFFKDMTSKHAMHSSASEEVYYAGEFTIAPSNTDTNTIGYKLVIDNNSGTYAPRKEGLERVKQLFEDNFSDIEVETIHFGEIERLALYHAMCPSRLPSARRK